MAFDDEDPTSTPLADARSDTTDEPPVAEDDPEDEIQDFRKFASVLQKTNVSSKQVRRGEKDYESHGTRLQENYLEASRQAMHETLSYTRAHHPTHLTRGWYFPDQWAGEEEEDDAIGLFKRERVVVLENARGVMTKTTGRVLKGTGKHIHTWDKTWLLPEEALFMVERGDLHLWWPERGIEDIFPLKDKEGEQQDKRDLRERAEKEIPSPDPNEFGLPLSLQAAYALFIGRDGERGKVTLENYQVYVNLRRSGYLVYRATSTTESTPQLASSPPWTLWRWLFSLLSPTKSERTRDYPPLGPLVKPGFYRSYRSIFQQLDLISRHEPSPQPDGSTPTQAPFKILYHVYKARHGFAKASLPPPDFRIAVVNARTTSVPTLAEMASLLESTPFNPPGERLAAGRGVGFTFKRLKHGWRDAIMAVVDSGFISYLRFTEMAFGEDKLYEGFDRPATRGGKRGGRNHAGRGGRGKRGGGRGRSRGG
ncbi:tRNA-splicing endonuclease subunit sen54 N-term-domain-containing protein [Xylariales sp. AK1849]|nr:tRNA-splicing endonuclease subunit sen54 N-term-domain-containing protein [Xylariales sp. AK1849]